MKKINIAELFAGVGGFRLGFENSSKTMFQTKYVNQWEPSTKIQHAYDCYIKNFPISKKSIYENIDIKVVNDKLSENDYIEKIDLVVGGFPCQDYSVAATKSKGIEGKKGILWWEIHRFLKIKNPSYILLENVDRLLISPRTQRGRDFLIMLAVLNELNYDVEWRVINASEYGFVQSRKRVFIFAYKRDTNIAKIYEKNNLNETILTRKLKTNKVSEISEYKIKKNILKISEEEQFEFKNYGFMKNGKIITFKINSIFKGNHTYINDVLLNHNDDLVKKLILTDEQKNKVFKLKDGGKKLRKKDGFEYYYSEGKMSRFDNIKNKKARTMLTSEGTINRSSHIIKINDDKYRFIHPIEAERINGFRDGWTEGILPERRRYFMMGNALVVDLIKKIADNIKYYENENNI